MNFQPFQVLILFINLRRFEDHYQLESKLKLHQCGPVWLSPNAGKKRYKTLININNTRHIWLGDIHNVYIAWWLGWTSKLSLGLLGLLLRLWFIQCCHLQLFHTFAIDFLILQLLVAAQFLCLITTIQGMSSEVWTTCSLQGTYLMLPWSR